MQVEGIIAKGQLVPLSFMQDQLAASQSDVQLKLVEAYGGTTLSVIDNEEYVMPFAGEIVAISYGLTAAASAGQMTIGPTIDGTEQTALTRTVTTATSGIAKVRRGTIPFSAGQRIGAEITTNSSWNGTTADLVVTIWVLLYVEGI
jgi:hypothetical protein